MKNKTNIKRVLLLVILSLIFVLAFNSKQNKSNSSCYKILKKTYTKEKLMKLVKTKPIHKSYCAYIK